MLVKNLTAFIKFTLTLHQLTQQLIVTTALTVCKISESLFPKASAFG